MFEYTTAVHKLRQLKNRERVIPGGTWAGKTYDIIAIEIDYLIKNPRTDTTVVAETIPAIKGGALKDFKEIMRDTKRWHPFRWNATDRIYTFANGSQIQFTAYADEDAARQAGKRKRLFVNEVNTIPRPIVDALAIRTEDVIWYDYNPTFSFWINKELEGKEDVDWLTLTYRDNEALPDAVLKELLKRRELAKTSKHWENWCNVYLDGKVGSLEGVCIPDWQIIDKMPVDEDGEPEYRLAATGIDFGFTNDPTAVVCIYKWNDAYILDEVIYTTGLYDSDISRLMTQEEVHGNIYADPAEPKAIAELKRRKHRVIKAPTGRDSIMFGISLMNQQKLYVTARSENLINELRNYIWAKDKTGEKLNKPIDAHNHAIDATRYGMMGLLQKPNRGKYNLH